MRAVEALEAAQHLIVGRHPNLEVGHSVLGSVVKNTEGCGKISYSALIGVLETSSRDEAAGLQALSSASSGEAEKET